MISRRTLGEVIWVDLESPTHNEVRSLVDEFSLDVLVAEELLLPTVRPRFEQHNNFLYVILHFPALRHTHKTKEQEVDFIIGKNFIITSRYDTIDSLHKFAKMFEVSALLDKDNAGAHAGFIFYYMIKKLYKAVEHETASINDALTDIEKSIFTGHEKEMVATLSYAGRDLLNLRQVIEPHRDILRELETTMPDFFTEKFQPYAHNLSNEYYRVHNKIMRQIESLRELRETNNSLLTTKQNEIVKTLTIMAFVTFPLTLIAGVFGMNTIYTPFVSGPYGFWIIIGLMLSAMFFMFTYFKHKGWL